MAQQKKKRLFVDAVAEIIDVETGQIVGMVYRWNTGERRKRWVDKPVQNYRLRELPGSSDQIDM